MSDELTKQELLDFLDAQNICVIATNGKDGYPNAATVGFSNTDDLKFFIITNEASRKALNIADNGKVAITVTNEEKRWTVQLEGDATRLAKEDFDEKYSDGHFAKLPGSLPFKDVPHQAFYMIVPTHLKLSDVSSYPWRTKEF